MFLGNPTQNNCPFLLSTQTVELFITGSFTVNENQDTWWWQRPQTSSFFAKGATLPPGNSSSGLMSFPNEGSHLHSTGDMSNSVYGFFYRLMGKTFNCCTDHLL
jgi:hypothetical protein